jgi:hypothetical protein
MSAGITLAGLATGLSVAAGVNSLTGGSITKGLGFGPKGGEGGIDSEAHKAADPFSPYRADFAKQYAAAMAPGAKTDPTQLAGYSQFQSGILDPAMEASKRNAAAGGMQYSGAESASLQKVGQQGYSGFMTEYLNRLATGSGAAASPAQGAQLGYTSGQDQMQGISQGLGGLATSVKGLSGMFKGSGSVGGADTYGQAEYGTGTGYDWSSVDTVAPYP